MFRKPISVVRIWAAAAMIGLLAFPNSVTAKALQADNVASVHYTCRFSNGKIVATTRPEIAEQPATTKSDVYVHIGEYKPLILAVGVPYLPNSERPTTLHDAIGGMLSEKIIGMEPGESRTVKLSTASADIPERERYLKLARVMRRPKERWFPLEQFHMATDQVPEPGKVLFPDSEMPWQILAVTEEKVKVRFLLKEGERLSMPFGPGIVHILDDQVFLVEMQVKVGDLVRNGPFVGRVAKLDDKMFTLDFTHPFGGEELTCEVSVESKED